MPPAPRPSLGASVLAYVYYPASVHPKHKRDVGNAILSRWPIESTFKLPHRSRVVGQSRLAAGAIVLVAGRRVRVYSLHLGSPRGIRRASVATSSRSSCATRETARTR